MKLAWSRRGRGRGGGRDRRRRVGDGWPDARTHRLPRSRRRRYADAFPEGVYRYRLTKKEVLRARADDRAAAARGCGRDVHVDDPRRHDLALPDRLQVLVQPRLRPVHDDGEAVHGALAEARPRTASSSAPDALRRDGRLDDSTARRSTSTRWPPQATTSSSGARASPGSRSADAGSAASHVQVAGRSTVARPVVALQRRRTSPCTRPDGARAPRMGDRVA